MQRRWFTLLAGVAAAIVSAHAMAQVKPEVLVEQRQAAMKLQGKYLYAIVPMAQGKIPYDGKIVARNAGYLDVLVHLAWDGFDASTKGIKSRALPEIWAHPSGWKAAQDKLLTETAKFVSTVKQGDEAAIKPAILELNNACNACHQDFRQRQ